MDNQNNASSGSFNNSQSDIQGSDMNTQGDITRQSDIQGSDMTDSAHAMDDALGGVAKKDPWGGGPMIGNSGASDSAPATDAVLDDIAKKDPWAGGPVIGNSGASGPITADSTDISNADTTPPDEEFVGSGGVGSAEYMQNLHKAHEEAGDDFNSAYGEDKPKA